MKPRIVREWDENVERAPACFYRDDLPLAGSCEGPAYLALPWPEACPYTPEAVMAVCEREAWTLVGVPVLDALNGWRCAVRRKGADGYIGIGFMHLTPEFMGEQKKCEHKPFHRVRSGLYIECPHCDAILSDRRHCERRKGERRMICSDYDRYGGRRHGLRFQRRTNIDRRRAK